MTTSNGSMSNNMSHEAGRIANMCVYNYSSSEQQYDSTVGSKEQPVDTGSSPGKIKLSSQKPIIAPGTLQGQDECQPFRKTLRCAIRLIDPN